MPRYTWRVSALRIPSPHASATALASADLRAAGKSAGLKQGRADALLEQVLAAVELWPDHAAEAGVPEAARLPLDAQTETILGVPVRKVAIPVAAGRNLAVLLEAAVRSTILQFRGIDNMQEFLDRQQQAHSPCWA